MTEQAIIISLMAFMGFTAYVILRIRNLFAVVMLSGIYSLLGTTVYVVMDAVDVAFTEAAVGAGISTVLMLATLALTTREENPRPNAPRLVPLALVVATGALLVYATFDMPHYGDTAAPIHHHVAPHYIEKSAEEVGPPNIVTSVLASYRGYDTLGEVFVIFTAAIGVLTIMGRVPARREKTDGKKTGDAKA